MSAACYTGIWTYTMELFPTSIRGSMYGLSSLIATPGYLLAPLTPAMVCIILRFINKECYILQKLNDFL